MTAQYKYPEPSQSLTRLLVLYVLVALIESREKCLYHLTEPERIQTSQRCASNDVSSREPGRDWQGARTWRVVCLPDIFEHLVVLIRSPHKPTATKTREESYAIN